MNGFFKVALLTAPVLAIVIYLSFFKVQEHTVRMEKESAAFDRDWAEGQAKFKGGDKAKLKQQAADAQKKLDKLDADLDEAKAKNKQIGKDLDKGMKDAESEATEKKLEARLKAGKE